MYNNMYKEASLQDYLAGLTGSQGHLNAPLYGAVGATMGAGALGAAGNAIAGPAGGLIGAGAGALMGGGAGYGIANANNAQTGAMENIVGGVNNLAAQDAIANAMQNRALMQLAQQQQLQQQQPQVNPNMKQGSVMLKQAAAQDEMADLISDMVVTKIASAIDPQMQEMDAYAEKLAWMILNNA